MSYTVLLGIVVALSVFLFWVGRRATHTTAGMDDQMGRYLEDNPNSILQNSPMVRAAEPGFVEPAGKCHEILSRAQDDRSGGKV